MGLRGNVIIQLCLLLNRHLDHKIFEPYSGVRAVLAKFNVIRRNRCFWCSFLGDDGLYGLGLPFCKIDLGISTRREAFRNSMAIISFSVGAALAREEKAEKAIKYISKALAVAQRNGASIMEARCEFLAAKVYNYLGDYRSGLDSLNRAMRVFDSKESGLGLAVCNILMSDIYLTLGHHGNSYDCAEAARMLFEPKEFVVCLRDAFWSLTNTYQGLGKHEECMELLTSFRKLVKPQGAFSFFFDLLTADCYLSMGNPRQAVELAMSAKTAIMAMNEDSHLIAQCDSLLANAYEKLGEKDQALQHRSSAANKYEQWGYNAYSLYENLSMCRISGNFEQALAYCQELEQICEGDLYVKFGMRERAALILLQMEKRKEALIESREAIDAAEGVRANLLEPELKESFLTEVVDTYLLFIWLCFKEARFQLALEYVERLKTRNLIDMLMQGGGPQVRALPRHSRENEPLNFNQKSIVGPIRNQLLKLSCVSKPACNELSIEPKTLIPGQEHISFQEIQALAGQNGTAIIYFVPLSQEILFFAISGDTDAEIAAGLLEDCKPEDIPAFVNALDAAVDASGTDRSQQIDAVLRQLNEKIYESLISCLNGISNVTFVPYAGFHLLPLHAMFSEENGEREYVVDKFSVTYAPSAKILKQSRSRNRSFGGDVFVGSANPQNDLTYSEHEAQAIAEMFGVGVNRKLTREALILQGRRSQVFHYTGHANGNALNLHGAHEDEDLYETQDIFRSLDLPDSWLVTLSACKTGKIKIGLTDEYIGLPSAFLHAGAVTVISSLWKVSDLSTTLLMTKMYEFINDGCGKAESLRKAQLWLKNPQNRNEHLQAIQRYVPWLEKEGGFSSRNRFSRKEITAAELLPEDLQDPYYWAGFVCTGAP